MNLQELKKSIMDNTFSSLYIFVGDEIGMMDIYCKEIADRKSLQIMRKDSVAEVRYGMLNTGFFGNEPQVYVVRGDDDFRTDEKAWDIDMQDSVLILLYDKINGRTKFAKHFKDNITEFEKMERKVIAKYITRKTGINTRYAEGLAEICGDSYDIAMLECNKIMEFHQVTGTDVDNVLKTLVNDGTIFQYESAGTFDLVDAVCNRRVSQSFELLQVLREQGEQSVVVLGALYNNLRAIMLIQACEDRDIERTTGLSRNEVYFNSKRTGNYEIIELVHALKLIAQTVEDIKTGRIDDSVALEYVLVNIL